MINDQPTLDRLVGDLSIEANQLEASGNYDIQFVNGVRYAAAQVAARSAAAVDIRATTLEDAAVRADNQPAMSRAVATFLRGLAQYAS